MATIPPVAFSSQSMIPPPPPSSPPSSFVYHQDHRHSPNQTALNLDDLNLYAQQLSNSAALCIEIGHYDRAISSLTKALHLLSKGNGTDNPEVENDNGGYLAREVSFWRPSSSSSSANGCSGGGRYIYIRPIRVHRIGHDVLWSVIILIVTFNLAIAHHLLAITSTASVSSGRETIITRAVKFYELTLEHYNTLKNRYSDTYNNNNNNNTNTSTSTSTDDIASIMMQCDQEESDIQVIESIQFDMILHNNLSQMHHLIHGGCQSMHRTYSQKLLSTLMFIIEPQMRNGCSNEEEDSSRIRNLYLHGFIHNTMHLVLKKTQSAVAA
jgi:hypothetical protein